MKTNKETTMIIISAAIGIALFLINFAFFNYNYLSLIAVVITTTGPLYFEYMKFKENKDIEEKFPDFLRDISENMKAGMTLPQAIKSLKTTNYGSLSPYVKKIGMQMDWGVPFENILKDFLILRTPILKRTVSTIIETYEGGGNVAETFESIAKSIDEINRIRKERYNLVYSQVITGYIIFFVFIGVIVALQKYLLPSLSSIGSSDIGISLSEISFKPIFLSLVLIQGFFSGLFIGKISEGKFIAGLKHCIILILVGFNVLTFL
jgi:flagellar protein FlaJ